MSLIVPPEMIKEINPNSGFINMRSQFGSKNLKGLFYTSENKRYIVNQLYKLITNKDFVQDTIVSLSTNASERQIIELVNQFKDILPILNQRIQVLIEAWTLPYREDHAIKNPVMELSLVNQEFITTTATTFIQSPDCIMVDYYTTDPNTGNKDTSEWDYGASSWTDGTWHPEHLFTQSNRNRDNPYWTPINVTFDTTPALGDAAYNNRPTAFHPRAPHYNKSRSEIVQPTPRQKNVTKPVKSVQSGRAGLYREDFSSLDDTEQLPVMRPSISSASQISPMYIDTPNIQDLLEEQSYPYIGSDEFSKSYHVNNKLYAPGPGPGNRYRYDFYGKGGFSGGGTFPKWQYSMNDRPYERNTSEGLREGGSSDRRVQRPAGYDMTALTNKSSY